MRVVWVYRDYQVAPERYRNKVAGNCEIFADREFRVWSGGLATWQILAPELERVLYVDQSVYNFLRKKDGFLDRFNQVILVDFEKELDQKYPEIDFFAAPKLWVLTQQTDPCFLVDTEAMLLAPLCDWYFPGSYVGIKYEKSNPVNPQNWTAEDRRQALKLKSSLPPDLRSFLNPAAMINAGVTSWPSPDVTQTVGKIMLQICEEVCKSPIEFTWKWTFCEESIVVPLIYHYKKPTETVNMYGAPISEETTNRFVEWSSPETVPHIYEDFKWWAGHHPNIPVEKMKEIDFYAEY